MLRILYPVVCNSDIVSAETELNSKDSALTLDIDRYGLRPSSAQSNPPPLWRDTTVGITGDSPQIAGGSTRATPLRRGSSFVLVTPELENLSPSSARLCTAVAFPRDGESVLGRFKVNNPVVESLLEVVVAIFVAMVLDRRDFPGFGLNTKASEL